MTERDGVKPNLPNEPGENVITPVAGTRLPAMPRSGRNRAVNRAATGDEQVPQPQIGFAFSHPLFVAEHRGTEAGEERSDGRVPAKPGGAALERPGHKVRLPGLPESAQADFVPWLP